VNVENNRNSIPSWFTAGSINSNADSDENMTTISKYICVIDVVARKSVIDVVALIT
jgi:hypothetical protein